MPTGYTAAVQDGKITTFNEFAIQCARGMGACIMMRDDPLDAPIPEEFQPSDHYAKALEHDRRELAQLERMTAPEIEAAYQDWLANKRAEHQRRVNQTAEYRARYEAMLAQVDAWEPPSPDHENFKNFMQTQLRESMEFDCYDWPAPNEFGAEAWHNQAIANCRQRIEWDEKHDAEERQRTADRNRWIRQLRESLEQPATA